MVTEARSRARLFSFRNLSLIVNDRPQSLPFEQSTSPGKVSSRWRPILQGTAVGQFKLDSDRPFIGSQSQTLTFKSGEGVVGIANAGLNHWGMNLVANKPYDGAVWLRADIATTLTAALENADGSKIYAEQPLNVSAGDWKRISIAVMPTSDDRNGRFTLKLKQAGSVTVGQVFLEPGAWNQFKGLPVRRDIAEALINQGVNVIRYGGSMVNSQAYRWKNMIGPRDRRPPYKGTWYPDSSNGWGVIDCLNFCEAAGITAIPDLNRNELPADLADFIEYVNGSTETDWGKRRATDGHPAPYQLRYLEIGNEERVDKVYADKFVAIAEAIWKKDPDIVLVVGDFAYTHRITDPDHITGADSRITNLEGQRQILAFVRLRDREVWFDVHVWSEALRPSTNLVALPSYIDAIDQLAKGAKHKVVVFELNANSHGQNRALANAMAINTIRRDNRVPVIITANALQPDGQNDNGWDQGLLFLNAWQVWLQPPGYVTQMQARNGLPQLVKCDASPGSTLDVTASRSQDGKILEVEVVNPGPEVAAQIDLQGVTPSKAMAHQAQMAASSDAVNTANEPGRVEPIESDWPVDLKGAKPTRVFPPHSFTILRFE